MKTFIKKITHWFMTKNIFLLYLIMIVVNWVCLFFNKTIFNICGFEYSQHVTSVSKFKSSFLLIPGSTIIEEIFSRWLPMLITLGIVIKVVSKLKQPKDLERIKKFCMVIVFTLIAIVFGLVHGSVWNVFLQGFTALTISAFYFRAHFSSDNKVTRWLKRWWLTRWTTRGQLIPLLSVATFHTVFNITMIF